MSDRVQFEEGGQQIFFNRIIGNNSGKKFWREKLQNFNINYNSFKQYRRGERTLPYRLFLNMRSYDSSSVNGLKFKIIQKNWWQSDAGKKGMAVFLKKFDKEQRSKWQKQNYKKIKSRLLAANPKAIQKAQS